jgi:hypothetical protein
VIARESVASDPEDRRENPTATRVEPQGVVVVKAVRRIDPHLRLPAQEGQVVVLVAISLTAICAMAGFAIDVGRWYQAHRQQQAISDASALAAAGQLPASTPQATADAQTYAAKNGGSVASIAFSSAYLPNDTVTVQAQQTVPATFLQVIGINSTTVKTTSVARAENLAAAWGSAPFAVINTQPELAGPGCPCLGVATTLTLNKVGPGGFEILDIDGSSGGTGQSILASWILDVATARRALPSGCTAIQARSSTRPK